MLREVFSAGILGVGAYIPENIRRNDFWDSIQIANLPNNSKNPFEGIEERRVFPDSMKPSDAEVIAGRMALQDANVSPEEIDLVMVHSMVQDEIVPANASLVQYKLGLHNAGAWNIDTCCSSFVTMAVNAANLIAMGQFKKILIVTSVLHSKIIDYSDYLGVTLGDAAGAAVMGVVPDDRGFIAGHCNSKGYYHDAFTLRERMPYNNSTRTHYECSPARAVLTTHPQKIREVGKNSIGDIKNVVETVLHKADITPEQVDMFLSHQPCHWAHEAWRQALNIREGHSYESFRKYGNLASSSIPVNMFEAKNKGLLEDGDIVVLASSGAGENLIAALFKWYHKS